MAGAVSLAVADHSAVTTMIGLAPWIPDRIDVSTLDGKRLAVVHGKLEVLKLWLNGVPFHHKPPFVPEEGSVCT
jgi:hypothetical protein